MNHSDDNAEGDGETTKTFMSTVRQLLQGLVKTKKKNVKIRENDNGEVCTLIKEEDLSKCKRNGSAGSNGSKHEMVNNKHEKTNSAYSKSTSHVAVPETSHSESDREHIVPRMTRPKYRKETSHSESDREHMVPRMTRPKYRKVFKSRRPKNRPSGRQDVGVMPSVDRPYRKQTHTPLDTYSPDRPSPVGQEVRPATPRPSPRDGAHRKLPLASLGTSKDRPLKMSLETVTEREANLTVSDELIEQLCRPDSSNLRQGDADYAVDVCSYHNRAGPSRKYPTQNTALKLKQNENGSHGSIAGTGYQRVSSDTQVVMSFLDDYMSNIESIIELQVCKCLLTGQPLRAASTSQVSNSTLRSSYTTLHELNRYNNSNMDEEDILDEAQDYSDDVSSDIYSDDITRDIDMLISDIESNWWYQ